TMLQRVVRILQEVVTPIVVVAAPDQDVPSVPAEVRIVHDDQEGLGPLAGLAAGLAALHNRAEAAYATSCDVPLLTPQFVRAVVARLKDHDLAIPRESDYYHPLAAVYRTSLDQRCADLLAAGKRRPLDLVRAARSCEIDVEDLRAVDPALDSLRNANTPDEYTALLTRTGFDSPAP
ncbi:MAG: NTP transferase domain-containing protein, partial [Planctomycetaceae bacterium]|nr:NTP transferase domain-containing protein [Planctomycetaceae bacterium]